MATLPIPRPRSSSAPSGVFESPAPTFRIPADCTIRSLECWSNYGCAGDRLSDAYAARAALAARCRYGLNHFGRLVFVFLPGQGHVEHEIQTNAPRMTRPTLVNVGVTETLRRMTRTRES